jgi:predicted RecB family nuclease
MKPAIIDITGIGPAAAETLDEHDIKSLADLASASVEKISTIPGFSETGATRVVAAAAELLAASGETQPPESDVTESGKQDKAAGKGKKGKKGKK